MQKSENRKKISEANSRRIQSGTHHFQVNNPMHNEESKVKMIETQRRKRLAGEIYLSESGRTRLSKAAKRSWSDPEYRKARTEEARMRIQTRNPMKEECNVRKMVNTKLFNQITRLRDFMIEHGLEPEHWTESLAILESRDLLSSFKSKPKSEEIYRRYYNHKVVSIEFFDMHKDEPVYDITIENREHTHNFAIDIGIFVHNCCPPPCHDSNLCAGSPTVFANGLQQGRIGDPVCCGSKVATGSPNHFTGP
jgi:hypothetical protein